MMNAYPLILILLGAGIAGCSLLPFTAKLKPMQAAGFAGGVLIILVVLLPPGKISLWGNSYEPFPTAKADEIAATGLQFDALSRRIAALEQKIIVTSSPAASPAQKEAAKAADRKAEQAYQQARAAADAARRRYLLALSQNASTSVSSTEPCSQPLLTESGGRLSNEDGRSLMSEGRDCSK